MNKADLSSLETDIDKLEIDKLETTPTDLHKLSNVVENNVVKKIAYDELVKKVNAIQILDTGYLVKKAGYNTKNDEIEKRNS